MKKNNSIHRFLVSFLAFYIVFSLAMELGEGNMIHKIVKQVVVSNMPAANYMMKEEENDDLLSKIVNTSPLLSYVGEQYSEVTDFHDPSEVFISSEAKEEKEKNGEADKDGKKETEEPSKKDQNQDKEKPESEAKGKEDKKNDRDPEETTVSGNVFAVPKVTGVKYSLDKLSDFDFLVNNFYTVSANTVVYKSDLNPKVLMKKDLRIKQDNSAPQILIYHTHSQERFADSKGEGMSVVEVGDYLTEILKEQYGYHVIHLRDSFDMVNGVLDRHKAYDYAYNKISQVLADNPTIELVIDLHRDGVDESLHFVTEINGKPTAKIMFFNGLSRLASQGEIDYLYNPYREDNLALSMQMKMNAEAYYPGFTRKNYLQAYEYNLSVRPKAMLIEAGAQTNSFEEELNAMEPLAVLLHMTVGNH